MAVEYARPVPCTAGSRRFRRDQGDKMIGLADAIEALRQELMDAFDKSEGPLRFKLEPIELTLETVVAKEGSGKIGWKVLEVGGSYDHTRTQTLKLNLSPLWEKKDGSLTSDFAIASDGPSGDAVGPDR